jgi:hypothetical protein
MEILIVLAVGLVFASVAGIAIVTWQSIFPPISESAGEAAERIVDLSVERFVPMLRLLDDSDFKCLSLQPGFRPEMAARVRRQRYSLFCTYLNRLRDDFQRVVMTLRYALTEANEDNPALAASLVRGQIAFASSFVVARIRAYLWYRGVGRLDALEVVQVFAGFCEQFRPLAPAVTRASAVWTAADDSY